MGDKIKCDRCANTEEIGGEITEETLEGDGWYVGIFWKLCPAHNDDSEPEEEFRVEAEYALLRGT